MNQFFYEQRGNEKLKELRAEGMRSQAARRAGSPGAKRSRNLSSLALIVVIGLGMLLLVVR